MQFEAPWFSWLRSSLAPATSRAGFARILQQHQGQGQRQGGHLLVCLGQVCGFGAVIGQFLVSHTDLSLLPCTAQEEAKVAALSERLAQMGVHVEPILAAVAAEAGAGGEEDEDVQ